MSHSDGREHLGDNFSIWEMKMLWLILLLWQSFVNKLVSHSNHFVSITMNILNMYLNKNKFTRTGLHSYRKLYLFAVSSSEHIFCSIRSCNLAKDDSVFLHFQVSFETLLEILYAELTYSSLNFKREHVSAIVHHAHFCNL